VRLWDISTHQQVAALEGHSNSVASVAFDPSGNLLVSGSADNSVRVWDVNTQQTVAVLKSQSETEMVFFPRFGETIQPTRVTSVAFDPSGKFIASGSSDNLVTLWDSTLHQKVTVLKGHTDEVNSVAFDATGRYLASCSGKIQSWRSSERLSDNSVRLWDVSNI
jgi:WD40 repeat protein